MADLKVSIKGMEGKQDFELELTGAQTPEVLAALWGSFKLFDVEIKDTYIRKHIEQSYIESAKVSLEQEQQEEQTPDRYGTNNTPLFRVRYKCEECDYEGERYAALKNDYVKCHACDTQLSLENASENAFKDAEGFKFKAEKKYKRFTT